MMNIKQFFKLRLKLVIFFILILYCNISAAEESFYVQSARAKVYSEASFSSKVITELTKGTTVSVIAKEGNWAKIVIAGKTGYLSHFLLGKNPPLDKVRLSDDKVSEQKDNPRSRVSQHTTAVAGVRGLAQERRARLGKNERVNYDALEKVESIKVDDEELKFFMKEGNL